MKKIVWSISSGGLLFGTSVFISVLITPYILKYLSKEEYAVFYLVNNIVMWFGVLRAGQNGGFRYQLSLNLYKRKYINRLYSTLIMFYGALSLFVLLIGVLSYDFIFQWLAIRPSQDEEVFQVYMMLLFNFSVSGLTFLFANIMAVYNREYIVNMVRIILIIVQALGTLMLLTCNYQLLALAIPVLVSGIVFFIVLMGLLLTIPGRPVFNVQYFNYKTLYESLSIGKWFLLGFLAQLFIKHTDVILVGKLVKIEIVTSFLLTSKLYFLATGVMEMVVKTLSPHFIKLYKKNLLEHSKWGLVYFKLFVVVTLCTGAVIYLLNEPFLRIWVGQEYFMGSEINFLMALAFVATSINTALRSLALSKVVLKRIKMQDVREGLVNLVLSVGLGYMFGVSGIIAATFIASLAVLVLYLIPVSVSFIQAQELLYAKKQGRILLGVFVFLFTGLGTMDYIGSVSLAQKFFMVTVLLVCFILYIYRDIKTIYQKII